MLRRATRSSYYAIHLNVFRFGFHLHAMDACTDQDKNVYNALLLLFEEWSSRRDKPPLLYYCRETTKVVQQFLARKRQYYCPMGAHD